MRGLSDTFIYDLKEGSLKSFFDLVKKDSTLNVEIYNNSLRVFYRGYRLFDITVKRNKYNFVYTKIKGYWAEKAEILFGNNENEKRSACHDINNKFLNYYCVIPYLKGSIDGRSVKDEYEVQQIFVRENNVSSVARRNTDYFCVAYEYDYLPGNRTKGTPDIIAVQFKSDKNERIKGIGRLAVIELKFGDNAISVGSGIKKHIDDTIEFFKDNNKVKSLKKEAEHLFNQKYELGLIKSPKKIKVADNKPQYILVLANHDPDNGTGENEGIGLYDILKQYENNVFKNFDLCIAISSAMGYGLYSDCVLSVEEFLSECKRFVKR